MWWTRAPVQDYAITHPLRPVIAASVLTLIFFVLTCALICIALWDNPAAQVSGVIAYIALFILFWTVATLIMAARRPSPEERVVVWGIIATAIILGSHIACIGVIWSVMPHASMPARLTIALFLLGCIPTQIICSPESTVANRMGTVTVLGSLALFLFLGNALLEKLAATYVIGFAGLMFALSGTVHRTVQMTVAARLASDAAARKLDEMLGEVAAQRDASTKFIASASHDLGQPLQAAGLFFDQTLRAPDGTMRDAAIDGVRKALSAADQLLSQMLSHLRLEADAVEPHMSDVHLPRLLERAAERHTLSALDRGIGFRLAAHSLRISLDVSLIDRALDNLINNALIHSNGRRILLLARCHGPSAVRIWVIDDGGGVSTTDADRIFDDYYQGSRENSLSVGGFGLGLASVRRITKLMHGEAGLDPRWRRGAAFYLEFPAHGREREASYGERSPP